MKLDARLTLFMTLVGVFLTSLLLGNLIAGKVMVIPVPFVGDRTISAGEIPFPLVFVLTDILNEFYGRKVVRRVTLIGLAMTALAFVMIKIAVAAPSAAFGLQPAQFDAVFASAARIQVASMVAFMVSQLIDITVFFFIKRATGNRMLWLRATGSTAISQAIDTTLVGVIGWGGVVSNSALFDLLLNAYLLKLGFAVLMTPVIYALHAAIERWWNLAPVPLEVAGADVGGTDGSQP
jgi:queuosine precursor transporter